MLGSDEEKALYALLRSTTDAILGKDLPADTVIRTAYSFYYKQSKSPNSSIIQSQRFAKAALYMGDWFSAKDSIKSSEDCYRQAINAAEKAKDWHTCYIAHERLAEQIKWSDSHNALNLIKRAIDYYNKCDDSITNLISLYHCAANYSLSIAIQEEGSFEEALNYAAKEFGLAHENNLQAYENQAQSMLANIYWAQDNYHEALSHAKQIKLDDTISEHTAILRDLIARCYLSCDSLEQAKALYQLPSNILDKKTRYLSLRSLTEIAIRQHDEDTALTYLDSTFNTSESIFFNAMKAKDDYYKEVIQQERANEKIQYKSRLRTWLFTCGMLFLLCTGFYIGRLLYLKLRIQHERRRNSITARKNEIEKHIIERKYLQKEQEWLMKSQSKKENLIKILQLTILDRTSVGKKLMDQESQSIKMSVKDWREIERLLDEIDDKSISRLRARNKELTEDDIHLCMLVRLHMPNPIIGRIYNITTSAVQHRKQKLKKEKFGVTNTKHTLEDVILAL